MEFDKIFDQSNTVSCIHRISSTHSACTRRFLLISTIAKEATNNNTIERSI